MRNKSSDNWGSFKDPSCVLINQLFVKTKYPFQLLVCFILNVFPYGMIITTSKHIVCIFINDLYVADKGLPTDIGSNYKLFLWNPKSSSKIKECNLNISSCLITATIVLCLSFNKTMSMVLFCRMESFKADLDEITDISL